MRSSYSALPSRSATPNPYDSSKPRRLSHQKSATSFQNFIDGQKKRGNKHQSVYVLKARYIEALEKCQHSRRETEPDTRLRKVKKQKEVSVFNCNSDAGSLRQLLTRKKRMHSPVSYYTKNNEAPLSTHFEKLEVR